MFDWPAHFHVFFVRNLFFVFFYILNDYICHNVIQKREPTYSNVVSENNFVFKNVVTFLYLGTISTT